MKQICIKIFWPILTLFETGEQAVGYKSSHRVILIVVGSLFVLLSIGSAVSAYVSGQIGALIPVLVFFSLGTVAVIVGLLGTNSAVVKIWGNR